ncbi:amino acid adenylation domain-containing protein [Brasilonema sp. CT11]|nr:amino acid adenylation domain-containing protein [Brasilonema sp. CT11]
MSNKDQNITIKQPTFTTNIKGFQLSPQQKRLWLLQQEGKVYYAHCAILLKGNLKVQVLEAALAQVINTHEILRTTFHRTRGLKIPIQVISDLTEITLDAPHLCSIPQHDWENREDSELELEKLCQSAIQQSFNWEQEPLLKKSLVKLSLNQHLLLISLPSLCADARTLQILMRDLSCCYAACLQGKELSNTPLQYVDIAQWQNELLAANDPEAEADYWQKLDFSILKNLKFPFIHEPEEKSEFNPTLISRQISRELAAKIEALAYQYQTSASVFFLACWEILLWRLTEQSDLIIGVTSNSRNNYEELQDSLGLLVKYLPLLCHLGDNYKFSQILATVEESIDEISESQDRFSWEQISELNANDSDVPFFPVCFEFESYSDKYTAGEVSFSIYKQYTCVEKFKLKLSCIYKDDSLVAEYHYDANIFAPQDIKRLASQFETLLASVVKNPSGAIASFDIVSPTEREQLLVELNNTKTAAPQYQCIHHWFESQCDRTPDNIAVVYENQQLTYQQLNAQANQLAHHLQQMGVGPEVMVGICVERSLDMVVGLLGILKAGGAYVPLDPTYPQDRLAFILNDAQVSVLLTQNKLKPKFPENDLHIVYLDTDWGVISQETKKNPDSSVTALNLAYVIYTSGSTGKPKGTMIPHQGLVNYLNWCQKSYAVADGCGAPVNSSISFDATITSLFSPLLVGQKIVLLPEENEIESLSTVLRSTSNFSLVKITPAHLQILNQLLPSNKIAGQNRALIIGGEALLGKNLTVWRTYAPDTRIVNEYGPTETVVGCCVYEVSTETSLSGIVPIGRPIANTQLYILNKYLQPTPIGVPGELYIGGNGLARGYLNRPELTAEKFIPNPFSEQSATRLYKTGDLARYLPNGEIEYIGRIDHQVKVRGFRIELGEIEAHLSQHPAVRETVVVVREDSADSQRLVAYVVLQTEQTLTITELRSFLELKLPNYMVPATFVMLEALPLTPNGKVDRQALPVPGQIRPELEKAFIAPQTTVEKQLAVIWAQVLGLEKIGINDNFFELGGDSILSLQIISKANQAGLHLIPKQLFQHQTIAQLAAVAGTTKTIQAEQGAVTGLLPLTPIQHWFFELKQPESHHWNQAVLLEVKQSIDRVILEQVMQSLQRHHDALRLRFLQEEFGTQAVIVSPDDVVPIIYLDLSALPKEEQVAAIEGMAAKLQASLNLSVGSLFRIALFDLGSNQPSRLLWVIHHLAVDGVSWRILIEDLNTAYQQLCQGKEIQLPPKTTSFKQWSHRLQEYAQSSVLHSELDYWLTSQPQSVKLIPIDYSRENNTEATACTVSVSLCVEETQVLLQQVPAAYRTQINDILLTAITQTFAQWTGESSLLIDLEGHGREELFEDIDLSRTVGWFTSIFPVHLSLENATSPGKALMAIKEQLRAIPNRGIGYGVLHYLSGDKEITQQLSSLPKAEVIFNYLGQFDQVLPESSLLSYAQESTGPSHSLRSKRTHLLEISGSISQGRLQMNWTYNEKLHRQTTVEVIAQGFIKALRSLITHCQSPEAGSFTPSDFPDVELSQEKLESALAEIDFS